MITFISSVIGGCLGAEDGNVELFNKMAKVHLASIVVDALVSITALVVGILGCLSMIHGMPPAAAYTLISLSGGITLIWIALAACSKGKIFIYSKELFVRAATGPSNYKTL